jgi:hypothetical protein
VIAAMQHTCAVKDCERPVIEPGQTKCLRCRREGEEKTEARMFREMYWGNQPVPRKALP